MPSPMCLFSFSRQTISDHSLMVGSATSASSTFLAPGTSFMEDNFSMNWLGKGWFQDYWSASHLLCIYFYFYYLGSIPDHQALDLEGQKYLSYMTSFGWKDINRCNTNRSIQWDYVSQFAYCVFFMSMRRLSLGYNQSTGPGKMSECGLKLTQLS